MTLPKSFRILLGVGLLSAAAFTAQADQVTFNVDMSGVTNSAGQPAYTEVRASGAFNGWSQSSVLTNNGANIYTNTFEVAADGNYKYTCVINGGTSWEGGADHGLVLTGSPQTLPLLAFNYDGPVPIDFVTNNITFQVDMTVQVLTGAFTNDVGGTPPILPPGKITVSGGFQGWNDGNPLTNNPALSGNASNIYTGTFSAITQLIPPSAPANSKFNRFKFRMNNGWEEPTFFIPTGNNDRNWDATTTGDRVLPLVFYSDNGLCDVLQQATTVTFRLHMTNGTMDLSGHAFDTNAGDIILINGPGLIPGTPGFAPWDPSLPNLTNNPVGSDFYEWTTTLPAGSPRAQVFKFSVNTGDRENGFQTNHIQYIRSLGSTFTLPTAEFGPNFESIRVESQFGNLKAGAPSGGNVPITWLGHPCVTLQSRSNLTSAAWVDKPATDSTSSTNYPNTGDQQYFRLFKRQIP